MADRKMYITVKVDLIIKADENDNLDDVIGNLEIEGLTDIEVIDFHFTNYEMTDSV